MRGNGKGEREREKKINNFVLVYFGEGGGDGARKKPVPGNN